MAHASKIEWTDATWNPTRGCSRVSEGCRNCYAERQALRYSLTEKDPFFGFVGKVNGHPAWTGKVELIESKLEEPLSWKNPRRIFVNSMSDLFHEALPDEAIDRVFAVMSLCPRHTFQVLTKRPDRMLKYLDDDELPSRIDAFAWEIIEQRVDPLARRSDDIRATALDLEDGPLPNCWLGVSVEDQKTADERIPLLLKTPAAIRFVSYEPALGPADFLNYMTYTMADLEAGIVSKPILDWIIVGGESGPGARPFGIEWARTTVLHGKGAGVPVFVKQLGARAGYQRQDGWRDLTYADRKGGDPAEWPADLRVREHPRVVITEEVA